MALWNTFLYHAELSTEYRFLKNSQFKMALSTNYYVSIVLVYYGLLIYLLEGLIRNMFRNVVEIILILI